MKVNLLSLYVSALFIPTSETRPMAAYYVGKIPEQKKPDIAPNSAVLDLLRSMTPVLRREFGSVVPGKTMPSAQDSQFALVTLSAVKAKADVVASRLGPDATGHDVIGTTPDILNGLRDVYTALRDGQSVDPARLNALKDAQNTHNRATRGKNPAEIRLESVGVALHSVVERRPGSGFGN